ncbi:MAG: class I SAM-dependent methyltransferase, partial [Lachnospiraceae bacterium]|nr:class I SAM-dependent methyltransferase [Lachnospiraceae bacterium]
METLDYYNKNARVYFDKTVATDFEKIRESFLSYVKDNAYILDFGCGSGRDAKIFKDLGYKVDAIDGSQELCRMATVYTGIKVKQMLFNEFHAKEIYDAVWACASILHLPYEEILNVMQNICDALKN